MHSTSAKITEPDVHTSLPSPPTIPNSIAKQNPPQSSTPRLKTTTTTTTTTTTKTTILIQIWIAWHHDSWLRMRVPHKPPHIAHKSTQHQHTPLSLALSLPLTLVLSLTLSRTIIGKLGKLWCVEAEPTAFTRFLQILLLLLLHRCTRISQSWSPTSLIQAKNPHTHTTTAVKKRSIP